jgi:activating signal cointegrator 1
MSDMSAISLHAPYGTLIALGAKRFETRSFPVPAKYVGTRIAIHQALRRPPLGLDLGPWRVTDPGTRGPALWNRDTNEQAVLPLGAVVCTAIVESIGQCAAGNLWWPERSDPTADPIDITDQLPYGDFAPNRWAWKLTRVETTVPMPCPDFAFPHPDGREGHGWFDGSDASSPWVPCPRCEGTARLTLPIPAKGRQGWWRWAL